MKAFRICLILMLVVSLVVPAAAERVDSNIRFNDLYGEVSIRPNDEEDDAYEYAELDTIIYENDRIKTEEESGAILGLADMSTFVVKPETTLVIHSPEDKTTKIEMLAGTLWGNIKKMAEGGTIEVEMSQCVAGIKGTIFKTKNTETSNNITVVNGLVEVTVKSTGELVQVPAGSSFTIDNKGKIEKQQVDIDSLKDEFLEDIKKSDEKLNDGDLLQRLNEKSEDIKNSTNKFEESRKTLQTRMVECVNAKDKAGLIETSQHIEELRLETSRYKGVLEELDSLISVANNRIGDSTGNISLKNAVTYAKKIKEACNKTIASIENLNSAIKKLVELYDKESKKQVNTDILETIARVSNSLDSTMAEARDVIESTKSGCSYAEFKDASEKLQRYLIDLETNSSDIEAIAQSEVGAKQANNLRNKYNNYNKQITKALTAFQRVPEISADTLNNLSDIEKGINDSIVAVNSNLNDYNSIEKSSVDAKKRYVSTMSRTLANFDRTQRLFTKSERMYKQVVTDFKSSEFKTSEYEEVENYWRSISDAMNNLGSQAEQLRVCMEELRAQLDDLVK